MILCKRCTKPEGKLKNTGMGNILNFLSCEMIELSNKIRKLSLGVVVIILPVQQRRLAI